MKLQFKSKIKADSVQDNFELFKAKYNDKTVSKVVLSYSRSVLEIKRPKIKISDKLNLIIITTSDANFSGSTKGIRSCAFGLNGYSAQVVLDDGLFIGVKD